MPRRDSDPQSVPDLRLHSHRGRLARSLLARRGQVLLTLDALGRSDLELIRQTRALTPLLLDDAPALQIVAWARSAVRLGGALAEAGVFRGGSARLICAAKGAAPLHLFDAFETLRESHDLGSHEWVVRDHFGAVHSQLEQVRQLLAPYPAVHFHPGWFPGSATSAADVRFCFVHLDLDLSQGTHDALEFFHPRMLPGAVLIGDDYNFPEVRGAFDDFFAGRSDPLTVLPWGQVVAIKSGS